MKKITLMSLTVLLLSIIVSPALFAERNVAGFWKTIDDETGRPKSVVAIYTVNSTLYGRIVMVYDEDGTTVLDDMYRQQRRSPYLAGNAPFSGLDIIWDMEYNSRKGEWSGGSILDPGDDKEKKPRVYGCSLWQEGSDLILRGKIAFFGRNQTWKPFSPQEFPQGFKVPDYTQFRPRIPQIK